MTDFIETPRFPDAISFGSLGGPVFNTQVVQIDSGALFRNSLWTYPQYEYDVAYGIKTTADLETLLNFFQNVNGRATGFRYKDWMDYKSCAIASTPTSADVLIGTGNGSNDVFYLYKKYVSGANSKTRPIYKPVSGTLLVAVAATAKTETTHYTVNYTTGSITFTAGNIPTTGQAVTAGFEFDVPVCFASDKLSINLSHYRAGSAQIPLIELKFGTT